MCSCFGNTLFELTGALRKPLIPSFGNNLFESIRLFDGGVKTLAVQADGKIVVGGFFTNVLGRPRGFLARLHSDGTLDESFHPDASGPIYCMALQTDGNIIVGGVFTNLCGEPRKNLGRLFPDGTLDPSFNPAASLYVSVLALQTDGAIVIGGRFSEISGRHSAGVARLHNPDPATQQLEYDGSTVHWWRGGASPEIWRATFDVSTNGTRWRPLGIGQRVVGGWRLRGVEAPASALIRARGFIAMGSSWLVESLLVVQQQAQPAILAHTTQWESTNRFRFQFITPLARPVAVQWSPNLVAWNLLGLVTNISAHEAVTFTDTNASNTTCFYRLVQSP